MKHIYTLLFLLPYVALAQTTHMVEAGGSTSGTVLPYYSPQSITINVGDIVQWNQVSGSHNVAGTLALYPNNPEGFSSGLPANGTWTFSHTFNIAGFYEYNCTQEGHGSTQFGSITVLDPQSVGEQENTTAAVLFPNPTSTVLTVRSDRSNLARADVVAMNGSIVHTQNIKGAVQFELDMRGISPGHYILKLTDANGATITRPFAKQ